MRHTWAATISLSVILTLSVNFASAAQISAESQQTGGQQEAWGTSESSTAPLTQPEIAPGLLPSTSVFSAAQFASGGVGLRNRGIGAISISGAIRPIKGAFIYWAVITQGTAPAATRKIKVQRLSPTPASAIVTVTGTVLGTGAQPCWTGNTITVFKGSVPTAVASGNGLYQVTLLAGASGSTAGGDPWVTTTLPLMEGASIVIVGTGPTGAKVAFYDSGLAGKTFFGRPGVSYSLTLPIKATGTRTLFENIGADGQHGLSRTSILGIANELTVINGIRVAGPGSTYNDSDWNGNAATPLPQLWDDTGHDITATTPNQTSVLNVSISNQSQSRFDCMTPVANIVQVQ